MKDYLVDIPIRINIWTRPRCQERQFEIIKKVRPSIIFIQSDGGRNADEWEAIYLNRKLIDEGIDWNCRVYKFYEDKNNGMYTMEKKVLDAIWKTVDRCVFLEDDHIPAVSFFQYCAELLEKYKDDNRIEMICGNNVLGINDDVKKADYFFTERGWSIWGIATWRNRALQNDCFPLPYSNDAYTKKCLSTGLNLFWRKKALGYCDGKYMDGHVPGSEYQHAVNSVLYHRVSIVPTKNMICNIGDIGEHVNGSSRNSRFFNQPVYEVAFPIRHPEYVIDDKCFGERYSKFLHQDDGTLIIRGVRFLRRSLFCFVGGFLKGNKKGNVILEK